MAEPGRLPIDLIPPLHCAVQPPDDATVKARETQTQLPERHSSGTQQSQQNIKSNLKSHVKKKKKQIKLSSGSFLLHFLIKIHGPIMCMAPFVPVSSCNKVLIDSFLEVTVI